MKIDYDDLVTIGVALQELKVEAPESYDEIEELPTIHQRILDHVYLKELDSGEE